MLHGSLVSSLLDERAKVANSATKAPLVVDPKLWDALSEDRAKYPFRKRENKKCAQGHTWPDQPYYDEHGRRRCLECRPLEEP